MFDEALILATEGRVLFELGDGTLGLGPASMALDDEVRILPGGNTWFVLRRLEDAPQIYGDGGFAVIGDCYLDAREEGVDDGEDEEAWDGGLPEEVLAAMRLGSNREGSVLERERIWLF